MVRNELIKRITDKTEIFFEKDVERSVKTIVNALGDALVNGERIEIRGFGSFYTKEYAKRRAVNPQTGEEIDLRSRRIPHFRISKTLHAGINQEKKS